MNCFCILSDNGQFAFFLVNGIGIFSEEGWEVGGCSLNSTGNENSGYMCVLVSCRVLVKY